jgi:hypothetical protein
VESSKKFDKKSLHIRLLEKECNMPQQNQTHLISDIWGNFETELVLCLCSIDTIHLKQTEMLIPNQNNSKK